MLWTSTVFDRVVSAQDHAFPSIRAGTIMTTPNLNVTIGGESVAIRPIRVTDAAMEAEFVRHLALRTKQLRFFGAVNELSPADLKRFCEVDGRHSMAFVATVQKDGRETEIGVCRYAPNLREDVREIAVTVADEWQHTELAKVLTQQLIDSARNYGVKQLYSVELCDNSAMRKLARELGMCKTPDPDDVGQVIYSLTL
jgi:acetyltransferase